MPNISVKREMMKASVRPKDLQFSFLGFQKKTANMKDAANMDKTTAPQLPYHPVVSVNLFHYLSKIRERLINIVPSFLQRSLGGLDGDAEPEKAVP